MQMIRRAETGDIPAIMRLLIQVDMVHHNGRPDLFNGPTTKYDETELAAILQNEQTPVFVFADDSGVRGHAFCMLQTHENDRVLTKIKTLYIDDICVDESARGTGIGSALYAHVLQYAREIDCYNVTLNVWTCNPGAQAFYEKCGMKPQKIGMETIL